MDAKDYEVMHTVTELERSAYRAGWKAAIDAAAKVCLQRGDEYHRQRRMIEKNAADECAERIDRIRALQPPVDTAPPPVA